MELLDRVLQQIVKEHKSDPRATGLRSYASGVFSIEVDDKPEYWFYDESDLLTWLIKKDNYKEGDNE
jgi:hypothetical protein